jgi:hypothetical protein
VIVAPPLSVGWDQDNETDEVVFEPIAKEVGVEGRTEGVAEAVSEGAPVPSMLIAETLK